jgi:hypothetical protein
MVNAFDSLDTTKPHAIDIHFETLALKLIGVTGGWIIGFDKLPPAGFTEVILFTSLLTILADVS